MRALLVGLGAVGARSARQLLSSNSVDDLVVFSRNPARCAAGASALGGHGNVSVAELAPASFGEALVGADVVVLSAPHIPGTFAVEAVAAGVPVVSVSGSPGDVRELLKLDGRARGSGVAVVAGCAMAPGLSCLLAAWAAGSMDDVSEVHIATLGTGGPACAVRRHEALREVVTEWRDGQWARRLGGSGRELVWFPGQPSADCYRTNRPDAELLLLALPGLRRVTSRAAASRRDRTTSWLPMLRRPHPEGTVGAVRVEVRGRLDGAARSVVLGAGGRPAVLAGAVAAVAALRAARRELRSGAGGLASLIGYPGEMLAELSDRGIAVMKFEGDQPVPSW